MERIQAQALRRILGANTSTPETAFQGEGESPLATNSKSTPSARGNRTFSDLHSLKPDPAIQHEQQPTVSSPHRERDVPGDALSIALILLECAVLKDATEVLCL